MNLEQSQLFTRLPAEELARVRGLATEQVFAAGDAIFQEGDAGDALYVVKTGCVQISAVSDSGQRLELAQVRPGEIFGEMAILDDQPRSATASAEEPTTVYRIPGRELLALLSESPPVALAVMRAISLRLREFNHHYTRTVLTTERMALIGRFANSIVHDLKSPLGTILMAVELGCGTRSNLHDRGTCRELVIKQVERVQNLVNEILEFTRGTTIQTALAETDYVAFVHGLTRELAAEARLSQIQLAVQAPAEPVPVGLDSHRLARVFYNLVHNATEAMPHGGQVNIRIQLIPNWVVTDIADTGPGLPTELITQLFEPFATYGKSSGTGLGLSICRKIIQEHGGQINGHNQPQGGAVFSFTLPRSG